MTGSPSWALNSSSLVRCCWPIPRPATQCLHHVRYCTWPVASCSSTSAAVGSLGDLTWTGLSISSTSYSSPGSPSGRPSGSPGFSASSAAAHRLAGLTPPAAGQNLQVRFLACRSRVICLSGRNCRYHSLGTLVSTFASVSMMPSSMLSGCHTLQGC